MAVKYYEDFHGDPAVSDSEFTCPSRKINNCLGHRKNSSFDYCT